MSRFHMGLNNLSPHTLFPHCAPSPTPSSFGLRLAELPPLPEFVGEQQRQDKVCLTGTSKHTVCLCSKHACKTHPIQFTNIHIHSPFTYTQTIPVQQTLSYSPSSVSSDNTVCYVKCNVPKDCLASILAPPPHSDQ